MKRYINEYNVIIEIVKEYKDNNDILFKFIYNDGKEKFNCINKEDFLNMIKINKYLMLENNI